MRLYTIGHSTRTFESFLSLLKAFSIICLADVRRFPSSRRNPQFAKANLEIELPKHDIQYYWLGESLGGFRKGGYVEHLRTPVFAAGLNQLINLATRETVAFMCAELLWFKCHRRFISDELLRQGHQVIHIIDERRTVQHKLREAKLEEFQANPRETRRINDDALFSLKFSFFLVRGNCTQETREETIMNAV